jgi:hypothetical protein
MQSLTHQIPERIPASTMLSSINHPVRQPATHRPGPVRKLGMCSAILLHAGGALRVTEILAGLAYGSAMTGAA